MDKIDNLKMGIEDNGEVLPDIYHHNKMLWV